MINRIFKFANGDPMEPVNIGGKKYYTASDVERKIEELEDRIRVEIGQGHMASMLAEFKEHLNQNQNLNEKK